MSSFNDHMLQNDPNIEIREQSYQDYGSTEESAALVERGMNRQKSFCEKYCSYCCSSRPGTQRSSSSSCGGFHWLGILNILLIAGLVYYLYSHTNEMNTRFSLLHDEMVTMQRTSDDRYNALLSAFNEEQQIEKSFESQMKSKLNYVESKYQDYSDALREQERQLVRLSNGTSNADVLDRLRETREEVRRSLQREHAEVFTVMQQSTRNVSESLERNSKEMVATQSRVETSLNQTVAYMQNVVGAASVHIHQIQDNVTREIDEMSTKVHKIVSKLGDNVKTAEDTIHDEVRDVQAKIEQYVIVTNKQFAAENDFVKYQLAGTFTLLGCLISMWHLTSHLRHYYKPDVQRRIMAVLWMVPIYSITSWLSMVFPTFEPFFASFRDCYEAYAIYTFIALLIAIIEDGRGLAGMVSLLAERVVEERDAVIEYERLVAERAPSNSWFFFNLMGSANGSSEPLTRLPARPTEHIRPPFPCCYHVHRPSTVAAAWLYQCQLMAAQFVILRPFLSVVPLILKYSGTYDISAIPIFLDGTVNWAAPNVYILFAQNLSVGFAFYGLLSFYHGTEKDLEWCDPWPKFLCIKGVVFATFWQSLTIQMLCTTGRVDERTASQVQNLLICIEMLLASIAHFYIFPFEEWKDGYKREREKGIMLKDTLALRDFVKDMTLMVTSWNTGEERIESQDEHELHDLDLDVLSSQKARLTSELHELASRSSMGTESRTNSVSGGGIGVNLGDLERGHSHSSVGNGGWSTYNYDEGLNDYAATGRERDRLLSHHLVSKGYHSPERLTSGISFDSQGLRREETNLSSRSQDLGRVSRQSTTLRLGGESNSEALKAALLKKLHQLRLSSASPADETDATTAPLPKQPVKSDAGSTIKATISSESHDDFDIAGIQRASEIKPNAAPAHRGLNRATGGMNASSASHINNLDNLLIDGRTDSLTFSPDSSAVELRRSVRAKHQSAHGAKEVDGEMDLAMLGVIHVDSEEESDGDGDEESDIELSSNLTPKQTPWRQATGDRTGYTEGTDTPLADPTAGPRAPPVLTPLITSMGSGGEGVDSVFQDVLTPPPTVELVLPNRGRRTSTTWAARQHETDEGTHSELHPIAPRGNSDNIFRESLSPPLGELELSPPPRSGFGTWSTNRHHDDDEDSDQSEYAI